MKLVSRVAFVAALVLSLALPATATTSETTVARLDVPFLPQTEALCGGAAAAMLFRYWGQEHASVQQFASLVDREAGGIADTVLERAIAERHWTTARLAGSIETLRAEIAAGRPPIALIEVRPHRYHYVVVVGLDDEFVFVHDPTWGPARRLSTAEWLKAWSATMFWTLRVTPTPGVTVPVKAPPVTHPPQRNAERACDAPLNAALDEIGASGYERADILLRPLASRCPDDGRPLRELAGVRFAQHRWNDASELARDALARDPYDPYATDVLAASRFMLNDSTGALRAWNLQGRPVLDSVRIAGLTRTRYAQLAEALALEPDAMLSSRAFELARRRLASMPDLTTTRLSLRPGNDGFAVVEGAVAERPFLPRSTLAWGALGARAAIERDVELHVPGRTGQGESWNVAWRWWEHRPRASVELAAPIAGPLSGVWRAGLSWERQTYGAAALPADEERLRGESGFSTWLTPGVRATATVGLDRWQQLDGRRNRTISASGTIERRLFDDRFVASISHGVWAGVGGSATGFNASSAGVSFMTTRDAAQFVLLANAGVTAATVNAPLALWSGAGEGRGRAPLLRAHSLLDDGRIDGPVFGRRLAFGTIEGQHWLARPSLARVAIAAFVDTAAAAQRMTGAGGLPRQVDAGVGLRIRVAGAPGMLRTDYAHGIRDGADAWTIGWLLD